MKVIYNSFLTVIGFKTVNLFGVLFARERLNIIDVNHERIHTQQMKELGYFPYYVLYAIEYFIKLLVYRDSYKAKKNISFEKEALAYQNNLSYLKTRKLYSQWRTVTQKKKTRSF